MRNSLGPFAVNAADDSAAATAQSVTTPSEDEDAAPPETPTLDLDDSTASEIDLSYTDSDGADLELEEMGPDDVNFHVVTSPSPGDGVAHIDDLAPDTEYSFRLRASSGGLSTYSGVVTASTDDLSGEATLPTPGTPSFDGTQPAPSLAALNFTFDWSGTTNTQGVFDFDYRATDANGDPFVDTPPWPTAFENTAIYENTDPPYTGQFSGGLIPTNYDTTYEVRVRASMNGEHSDWSDWGSTTTPGDVPDAPTALEASDNGNGTVTLTWSPPDDLGAGQDFAFQEYTLLGLDEQGDVVFHENALQSPSDTIDADPSVKEYVVLASGSKADEPFATSLRSNAADNPAEDATITPLAPGGLSATPYTTDHGTTGFHLLWDNTPNNEDGFALQWSADSGPDDLKTWHSLEGDDDTPTTNGADDTQYDDPTDHGIPAGGTISYRVGSYIGDPSTASVSWAPSIDVALPGLSVVSIEAIEKTASAAGPDGRAQQDWLVLSDPAGFTGDPVQLTQDESTAVADRDYTALPETVTPPAGTVAFVVPVDPVGGSTTGIGGGLSVSVVPDESFAAGA